MLDLFGNEHPEGAVSAPSSFQPDLFRATAEGNAYRSGRALSQEYCELLAPFEDDAPLSLRAQALEAFQDWMRLAHESSDRAGTAYYLLKAAQARRVFAGAESC